MVFVVKSTKQILKFLETVNTAALKEEALTYACTVGMK